MNNQTSAPSKASSQENKATLYALITILFWSTVATAFKIGLRSLLPEQLILVASLVTVLVIFSVMLFTGKIHLLKTLNRKFILHTMLLGFFNPFLYYLILFEAYSLLPAQVAQPINMIWPIVLVLLSVPLLKQKITWRSFLALVISFGGVFLISTQGKFYHLEASNPKGIMLGLLSAFIWSFFWIFSVKNKADELIKLFFNFVFGSVFLIVYVALFSTFKMPVNESLWAGVYVGLFEIGFAFILWMKALSLTKNNTRLANLIYIAPFLSLIFIHFILGEEIYSTTIIGIILIISGILFQQTEKKKLKN